MENILIRLKKFDDEVKLYYRKFETKEKEIISDGIVNPQEYLSSPIKILWILKEPYDIDGEGKGGWPINESLNNEKELQTLGGLKSTWYPIAYTSFAILNGFKKYEDMDDIEDNDSMLNVFKKIAFINVQKFAANTTTNDKDIKAAYKAHSRILLKQIEIYNPDIVIGGNTMWNFVDDLELKDHHYDEYEYWIKDNKLYINAAHPSIRGNSEAKEEYVNDIVRIAMKYIEGKQK